MKVLIVGFAVTGEAVARHLLGHGDQVVAVDDRADEPRRRRAVSLGIDLVETPSPGQLQEIATQADLVVVSPGVPAGHPVFATDAPVVSELELAGRAARAKGIPLIAITGTNGKTTVTTLVAEILNASGVKALPAGNIGMPLIEAVEASPEVLVVEASSFQLAMTEEFRPQVATWLNLSEDHLDWHPSMTHYTAAKARVWANQGDGDVAVANWDDPVVRAHARSATARTKRSYGVGTPSPDWFEAGGRLWAPGGKPVIALSDLWRGFPHDRSNALAACATAFEAGGTLQACRAVLAGFSGLHHRLEMVKEAGGVRWYNDSKATTPASVLAAMAGFDSVVLIAGGRNKGLDLTVLADARDKLRAVVAIGEASKEIETAFGSRPGSVGPGSVGPGSVGPVQVLHAQSMSQAVLMAASAAHPGDAVLLSPGCSSFDWYGSYVERGEDFARLVVANSDREVAS